MMISRWSATLSGGASSWRESASASSDLRALASPMPTLGLSCGAVTRVSILTALLPCWRLLTVYLQNASPCDLESSVVQ